MSADRPPLALVGPGAAGSALLRAWARAGWPVAGVVARTHGAAARAAARLHVPALGAPEDAPWSDAARLVVLAVRDRDLAPLAGELSGRTSWEGRIVLHLSGALPAAVLEDLRGAGAAVGSLHPLMTFPRLDGVSEVPPDTPFAVEGDPEAVRVGRELAAVLGAPVRLVPAHARPLYHCAATIAGNLSTVLLHAAGEVLGAAGMDDGTGLLGPLARESVNAAAREGAAAALTGPIARGDVDTVARHLAALRAAGVSPGVRRAHAVLSLEAVELARRADTGASQAALDRIARLLEEALEGLDADGP